MESPSPAEFLSRIIVGPGEFAVSGDSRAALWTSPLGAGLGVSVYDPQSKAGGLLHALLPDWRLDPPRAAARPALFVDTGLTALLKGVHDLGATLENLVVCIAGGGRILEDGAGFELGAQNCAALDRFLDGFGLKIHAAEINGPANRIMRLHISTGQVRVRLVAAEKDLIICQP